MDIGRNDPCPCGSGKKYKKCCQERDEEKNLGQIQEARKSMVDKPKKKARPGLPREISAARLDLVIRRGYGLLSQKKPGECCTAWLELWEELKRVCRGTITDIDDTLEWNPMGECIPNWAQDLEMELGNAGLEQEEFLEKRITYCREFCEIFPESREDMIHCMKRATAETHFFLGQTEKGEMCFQDLTAEFPENVWSFIGWGDMYLWPLKNKYPQNIDRAEEIYQRFTPKTPEDIECHTERLQAVKEERAKGQTPPTTGNSGDRIPIS